MLCLEPRLVFRLLEGIIYGLELLVVGDVFDKRLYLAEMSFDTL